MANYDNITIQVGMFAMENGQTWMVKSVNGDSVLTVNLNTNEESTFTVSEIKTKANSNEIWVAWPPNLRQENM